MKLDTLSREFYMFFHLSKKTLLAATMVFSAVTFTFSQAKPGDGTDLQRVEVMREKLDRIRRSLSSVISVIREENKEDKSKKDDEKKLDTPLGRLVSLDKDAGRLNSDVNNLRGKIDRGEKYERSDLDVLEQSVSEFQT